MSLQAAMAQAEPAVPAPAAAGEQDRLVFDIPAQPLALAIVAFGERTGVQVLYDSALAEGRHSAAVKGLMTREAALQTLLAGTNLAPRRADANSFVLLAPGDAAAGAAGHVVEGAVLSLDTLRVSAPASDFDVYGAVIGSDLQKALRKDARTRSGNFIVRVNIWIDPAGTVRRAELASSTGNDRRDEVIVQILNGFAVSQAPPAGMPQPVAVVIDVRPL